MRSNGNLAMVTLNGFLRFAARIFPEWENCFILRLKYTRRERLAYSEYSFIRGLTFEFRAYCILKLRVRSGVHPPDLAQANYERTGVRVVPQS